MKYRIIKENGKYFIQKKNWLWWSYVEGCYMYGMGVISFAELVDAEKYLDNLDTDLVIIKYILK